MRGFLIIPLLSFVFLLFIPAIIGIYVYKDAESRNMNAILWALIAAFTPTYIGLIVYLIIRSDYEILHCAACNAPVERNFSTCPSCGVALKATCEHCNYPLQAHWKVCPECSTPISHYHKVQPAIKQNDTSIVKLLIFVVLLPILLVVIAFASFILYRVF
jgi:predicted amidophosphoribosyltransferase